MRARRAGAPAAAALGGERHGRVVAVHERAVNLLLDDGPLVALLPAGAPLHPWAVELDGAVSNGAGEGAAEGDAVRVHAGALEAGALRVALDGLAVEELLLRARPAALDPAAVRALARMLPPPRTEGPFASALAAALAAYRDCGEAAVLAVLVGIGEGLTPSGDDVIVGALAALDALGAARPALADGRRRLGEALAGCRVRTTRLAAQMITAARDGRYAEPLLAVLEALAGAGAARCADAPPAGLAEAAAALLAVGHRSGADTLRGVCAVLEEAIS